MRDLIRSDAAIALPSMLGSQLIITMAAFAVPVVAPVAAPEIGVPSIYVGGFTSLVYLLGMTTGLFASPLIARLGSVRLSQCLLLMVAAGIAVFNLATPLAALAGAVAIGIGTGSMNPVSTHLLARTTPPRWRAFTLSVKQTGTPGGGMLAGVVIPPLVIAFGWQAALTSVIIGAVVVAALLQAARPRLDAELQADRPAAPVSITRPLRVALSSPPLRAINVMGFAYAGAQVTLASYMVVFFTEEIGIALAAAGLLYAVFSGFGIPIRLVWGVVAERWVASRTILIVTGIAMIGCFLAITQVTPAWSTAALLGLAVLFGISANGWVGLYFAEIVRLAPEGSVADASSGSQFFSYGGIMVMPIVFGTLVALTGGYVIPFCVLAALCGAALLYLLVARETPDTSGGA
jgi:predicted MFS family arabinose efflux permease